MAAMFVGPPRVAARGATESGVVTRLSVQGRPGATRAVNQLPGPTRGLTGRPRQRDHLLSGRYECRMAAGIVLTNNTATRRHGFYVFKATERDTVL